jgi:hypothetical protein
MRRMGMFNGAMRGPGGVGIYVEMDMCLRGMECWRYAGGRVVYLLVVLEKRLGMQDQLEERGRIGV